MIAEGISRLTAAFRSLYIPVHESRKQGFGEAYLIFFLLGVGFLLPWNAFITAIDYFSFLYPHAHVGALFSVAYMVTCLTSLLLLLRFGSRVSSHTRIVLGFSTFTLLMLSMPAVDFFLARNSTHLLSNDSVQSSIAASQNRNDAGFKAIHWPPSLLSHTVGAAGMIATVVAVGTSGVIDACVQGSLFGMAGQLHEGFTQALVGGTSASGLIVSALRMTCKALLPDTPLGLRLSADIYFFLAALLLCVCIAAFLRLEHVPFVAHRGVVRPILQAFSTASGSQNHCSGDSAPTDVPCESQDPARGHDLPADRGSVDIGWHCAIDHLHGPTCAAVSKQATIDLAGPKEASDDVSADMFASGRNARADGAVNEGEREREALLDDGLISSDHYVSSSSSSAGDAPHGGRQADGEGGVLLGESGWQTLQQIWQYTAAITSIYVVTLSLFPGFLTELKSPLLGSWFPVVLTSAMNLTDFLGKMFPAIAPSLISPPGGSVSDINVNVLLVWSLARVPVFFVLFPLFSWSLHEGWLRDVLLVLTTFIFGFSNGLLTSCLMMAAPNKVDKRQAETAGVLMVLFLVTGLLLGSVLSWAWLGL